MKAKVFVTLKRGLLDPQGKVIELDIGDTAADQVKPRLDAMCQKLLANTVIEDYRVELVG